MDRVRRHLTFANVVSVVALFVALGGTAVAATIITSNSQVAQDTISGHNPPTGKHANIITGSVNGTDLANGAVGNKKLANGAVTTGKLAGGAVTGPTVADNSLGGTQINESTLGKVPNADALDGIDSSGFIQGSGRILTIDTSAVANDSATLFDVPGFVKVLGLCGDTNNPGQAGILTYSQPVTVLSDNGGQNADNVPIGANTSAGSSFWSMQPTGDSLTLSIQASGGKVATAFIFSYAFHSNFLHADVCKYQGHVIVQGA